MESDKGAKNVKAEHSLSSTTLFVRNLPFVFDNKELEKVFSEVGPVKRCFVVKDNDDPNKCRGFGYVTFALKDDAIQAQEKIRQINGRKLFISFSNKKPRHIQRGPPEKKTNNEAKGNEDGDDIESPSMDTTPSTAPQQPPSADKPKNKPKSKRSSAMNDDGRTIIITGFPSTFNIKQLKKACRRNGEIEQFVYPVENDDEQPTAHVLYKSHKVARVAANNLNGKTVKGEVLNAVLRSKENKNFSQKSLKKSRLIVRNLPFKCSRELLQDEFSKFGEISEVVMPTKMVGKKKKKLGFAFVQFQNVFEAAKALETMNQTKIKGRPIAVDWTLPKKKYELLKVSEDEPKDDDKEKNDDDDLNSEKSAEDEHENEAKLVNDQKESGDEESEGEDFDSDGEELDKEDDMSGEDDQGSDDGDGSDDDDGSDDESPRKKKKPKLRDAREGKTIFIRNLPFDATQEEICEAFEEFGEIAYCKIVVDSLTEHSRGSAFVKFQEKDSTEACLKKYGDENDGSEELSMRKRPISVTLAVTKGKVPQLLAEKDTTKKTPRDKRNLYLAKEGVISAGSEAADGLSKSDLQKRQKAEAEKKTKLKMPHFVVSKTRLCLRNLPLNIDDRKLSDVLRTVCDGKAKTVGKVRIMRSMDRLDGSGVGRSKGFGFAEFTNHDDALDVLRATNNNPEIFGADRRPIAEFAIENSLILKRLEQRKSKNLQKVRESKTDSTPEKRKRERGDNRKRKRAKKDVDNSAINTATEIATVGSNAISSHQLERGSNVSKGFKNKNKAKNNKVLASQNVASNGDKNTARVTKEVPSSRTKQKRKQKVDKEEENFNEIVEKYKTKLFGENSKQLKSSRWFDA